MTEDSKPHSRDEMVELSRRVVYSQGDPEEMPMLEKRIVELAHAYVDLVEQLEARPDWPKELHEQYLAVLSERDELQEQLEMCQQARREEHLERCREVDSLEEQYRAVLDSLRETLSLALVANEGDPWYAEDAGLDATAITMRAQAILLASKPKEEE